MFKMDLPLPRMVMDRCIDVLSKQGFTVKRLFEDTASCMVQISINGTILPSAMRKVIVESLSFFRLSAKFLDGEDQRIDGNIFPSTTKTKVMCGYFLVNLDKTKDFLTITFIVKL